MIKLNVDRVALLKDLGCKFPKGKGVEVGTFKGEFSKEIMKNWDGTLYMIDVWRGLGEEYKDSSNHNIHTSAYADAMKSIEGYEDRAIMVRTDSVIGSKMFEDESLDFVYIDANHAYDWVVADIKCWFPKVKKDGFLLGHDYIAMNWDEDANFMLNGKDKHIFGLNGFYYGVFGVNPAVDEFCKEQGYTLTITNEWFGTWMIQK